MGQTVVAAAASGLALAGVLAVVGAAAARVGVGLPHLALGAAGAAGAAVAGRFIGWTVAGMLLGVAAAGAAAGVAAWLVDRRVRAAREPVWPPALLAPVAALGVAVAVAAALRPPASIDLPLGPLGGLPTTGSAVLAGVTGLAAAVGLALWGARGAPAAGLWSLGAAVAAVVVAVGGGSVPVTGEPLLPAFGMPDVVGIGVRGAAVGVAARGGPAPLLGAAVVLGVGESLARAMLGAGEVVVLPAVAILLLAAWRERDPAAEPVPVS